MEFDNKRIEYIDDCGENEGGIFCMIYESDENGRYHEDYSDSFCITKEQLCKNPDIEFWIKEYMRPNLDFELSM